MDYIAINNIKEWLKTNLDKERFLHSLGAAECAKELAERFGLDAEKSYFTGLIHDCAKCLSKDISLKLLEDKPNYLPSLECGEFENPKTHHAPIGAYLARTEFGITDEEVLSAIRWHTIGKISMTDFEKIIFIADKIEKRTRPDCCAEPIRQALLDGGLDNALLSCYKNTIKSLVDRNLTICTATIDIYNELLKNLI